MLSTFYLYSRIVYGQYHPRSPWSALRGSEDEVDTAVSADDRADFADLEGICCIFEWLLHLPMGEPAKIAAVVMGGTIRVLLGEFCELRR